MQNPHRARRPARRNFDSMRCTLAIAAAVSSLCCSIFPARSDEVPYINVRPICHGIASQSGESLSLGLTEQFQQCVTSEQEVHEQLKTEWHTFSAADKRHCVSLVKVGGEASYTELITCLEMARDVRALKAARSAPSGGANVDTPSGPAPSTSPPKPSPKAAAPPTPANPSEATSELQKQIEQARTDADTAKRSNEEALRKAADAEAALRQEKEEVERLKTEAERAQADAQSAKVAQASLERKLAEMESPRRQMERRAATSETAERRLRIVLTTLLFVIGALAVAVIYLLRKLRAAKSLFQVLAPGVVPESNSADAKEESG